MISFLMPVGAVFAATITATVDRNPVALNESFQLVFSANESPDGEPDFSPLRQNFSIINQAQNNQIQRINGKTSRLIQWTLVLMAKRTGRLEIPPIAFGDDKSNPLTIDVMSPQNVSEDRDLFLTVDVNTRAPYVQSQLLYTLRFYRKVAISQASLDEPELDDAVIERLGEDKNFDTAIKGVRYRVTERRYAIFPQKSGRQVIKPVILMAEVISGRQRRFGFFGSQLTVPKRILSESVELNVKAIPNDYHGHWLPAEQVVLQEQWSKDSLTVNVGEPLTRTLTLLAKGATDSQLPTLWPDIEIEGLKSYPDQPVLREQKKADGLIAFREEKIALIPSKPGEYRLPEIKIHWFNSKTEQEEVLSLPAVTIQALAVKMAPASSPAAQDGTGTLPAAQQKTAASVCPKLSAQPSENASLWRGLAVFFAGAWLLTLGIVFWHRKKHTETPEQKTADTQDFSVLNKALKQACYDNNPQAAKNILLEWGKQAFGVSSLSAIKAHCEARLRDQIDVLMASLYALETKPWDGKKLYQAFAENNARQKTRKTQSEGELKDLYQ